MLSAPIGKASGAGGTPRPWATRSTIKARFEKRSAFSRDLIFYVFHSTGDIFSVPMDPYQLKSMPDTDYPQTRVWRISTMLK